jgi:hypothetical protein
MSPTERTLRHYREQGWTVEVVERWISYGTGGVRRDLFGFIDIVGMQASQLVGIQATTSENLMSRVHKIRKECAENASLWLGTGATIQVIGWKRYKKPVERKFWRPRIVNVLPIHLTHENHILDDLR